VTTVQATGDVLLQVRNHHTAAAGTPPRIDDADPDRYVGYFENPFGEQAVFVFDRSTRTATLYLGDAGWETGHAVIEGVVPDLVLGEAELLWLRACWQAATGKRNSVFGSAAG
jgi:hypothetical protein